MGRLKKHNVEPSEKHQRLTNELYITCKVTLEDQCVGEGVECQFAAYVRSVILGVQVRERGWRLRDAKMQIKNQVPSSHICMASSFGHNSLVLLLPVSF